MNFWDRPLRKPNLTPFPSLETTIIIPKGTSLDSCEGGKIKNLNDLKLVAHELVHAVQYEHQRSPGFVGSYLSAYWVNVQNAGLSGKTAYECIPQEVEAIAFEEALDELLKRPGNVDAFNRACCAADPANLFGLPFLNADAKGLAADFKQLFQTKFQNGNQRCASLGAVSIKR